MPVVDPASPDRRQVPSSHSPEPQGSPPQRASGHALRAAAAALLAVAAATVFSLALGRWLAPNFLVVYLAAVVVAAWYGGLAAGLGASALSLLVVNYFFMGPARGLGVHGADDAVKLGVFAGAGYVSSLLSGRLRDARDRAEREAAEGALLADRLREQAVELELQAEEGQALTEELEEQVNASELLRQKLQDANARLREVTDRARAAGERMGRVLETMAEGVLLVEDDGRIGFANEAAARILGTTRGELTGLRVDDPRLEVQRGGTRVPTDEMPSRRALREGGPIVAEELELVREGQRIYLRVNAAPLRGTDGDAGVVVTFDDVTEDRRAADALRETEARFRTMADSAPVLVWMSDAEAQRTWFNLPWLEFTGRSMDQETGNRWAEGVHPDDYPRCLTLYLSSFEARRPFRMEYRLRRADGEYRWVLDHGVPLLTAEGALAGYIGSAVDITERRESEEQMRFLAHAGGVLAGSLEVEETLRRLARLAVPTMADVCVVDLLEDGVVRRVEAYSETAPAALLRGLAGFTPALDSRDAVAVAMRIAAPVRVDAAGAGAIEPLQPEGVIAALGVGAFLCVPLLARGRVLGTILLCATVSGRRYDEAEEARAEELARRAALAVDNARLYQRAVEANRAKSDFLAVMSHELRTPLNAILGYADLFLLGIPAALPEPLVPQVERVRSAARHRLELIEEILTFARSAAGLEEVRAAGVSAAEVARETADLVEPLAMERGIAFDVRLPEPDFTLSTDARKVRQILTNLVGNAVKFTSAGSVALAVTRDEGAARFVVTDTGPGIAPEHLERIFEPFWQADQGLIRAHGGSGLGLAVARQLARLLGGDVTVVSRLGAGSEFTLTLPLS